MEFSDLAGRLEVLEQTSSRTEMTGHLRDLFFALTPTEVRMVIYMMNGRVSPKFTQIEFNVADKTAIKAVAVSYKRDVNTVSSYYKELGDLGLVAISFAKEATGAKRHPSVKIKDVFVGLEKIAGAEGSGSQSEKINLLATLLSRSDPVSAKYIVRIILKTLRLGFGDKTVIDALSWSIAKDKSLSPEIDRAYAVTSDLGMVGELIMAKGTKGIEALKVSPGRPMAAQLAQREDSFKSIYKRLGKCIVQPKLDGLRGQIHKWSETTKRGTKTHVAIYSRNQETLTDMFPEIVMAAKKLRVKSFVIDSEIIGYHSSTNEFYKFQETITRRRKHEIAKHADAVPVTAMCFDLMYLNGKDLTSFSYQKRINKLSALLAKAAQHENIKVLETTVVNSADEIEKLFEKYVSLGLEGVMCKEPNSAYSPGARNYDWIKFKRAAKHQLADTIDGVVLGYYKGKGKHARYGIGALLIGVYSERSDRIQTVAKVGSGFRESEMPKMKKALDQISTKTVSSRVEIDKALMPDVITEPEIICVIRADEITRSPVHTAGKDQKKTDQSGYALRFPRIIEFDRKDLSGPENATRISEIQNLYKKSGNFASR